MRSWHVHRDDSSHGPFDDDTLRALAANGQLAPTDLVSHDNGAHWHPAAQIPGLFSAPESAIQLPGMQPGSAGGGPHPMQPQGGPDTASPVPIVPVQSQPLMAVPVQPLQASHAHEGDEHAAAHGHAAQGQMMQGQMMQGPAAQHPMQGQAMYGHPTHGQPMQGQGMPAMHAHPGAAPPMQGHPGAYPTGAMHAVPPHGQGAAYGQPVASGPHGTFHPSPGHVHHAPPPGPYEERRETDRGKTNPFVWAVVFGIVLLLLIFLYGWWQQ